MKALSGYNSKRGEFDVEYDNDAEQILAEMEFKDTDTEVERETKLQVLWIYSKSFRFINCKLRLGEARVSGCVMAADAYQFIEQKRTKEAEQGGQIGISGKTLQRPNFPKVELGSSPRDTKDTPTAIQAITSTLEEWDISDFEGAELLSESMRKFSPLFF
ncbi:hypothetical protein RYX36_025752 [Vicia faba]